MRKLTQQIAAPQSREFIQEFRGYNHNLRCANNEFYDDENMTCDDYPVLSTRKPRHLERIMNAPVAGMIQTSVGLFTIENGKLYLNGIVVENFPEFSTAEYSPSRMRQIVQMGAYLVFFPDKLYLNTADRTYDQEDNLIFNDWGSLEQEDGYETGYNEVAVLVCNSDGSRLDITSTGPTPNPTPVNSETWLDTSDTVSVLKKWSESSSMWVPVTNTYVKLVYPTFGVGLKEGDGVTISGLSYTSDGTAAGDRLAAQIDALNGSHIIISRHTATLPPDPGTPYGEIVITGIIDNSVRLTVSALNAVTIRRTTPAMQYVVECNNRLWGCYYGMQDGKLVNEIYCCALGDFTNWEQYQGVSTDSWRAGVGSDGQWTGAVTYQGHPLFWKEDRLHKVYVSAEGAHQIVESECYGVQHTSWDSLRIVNGILYYKANTGVCAYDGSAPVMLDDVFNRQYDTAIGGRSGSKYLLSMIYRNGDAAEYYMFVYDTMTGIWHRESTAHQIFKFINDDTIAGDRYYIWDRQTTIVVGVATYIDTLFSAGYTNATTGMEDLHWAVESGIQGFESPDYKYTSRYNLRMQMPRGSSCDLYIRYDEETRWRHMGHMAGPGLRPFTLPIKPRRCDHFQWKLDGYGEAHIYSLARISEGGSDVVHGYD